MHTGHTGVRIWIETGSESVRAGFRSVFCCSLVGSRVAAFLPCVCCVWHRCHHTTPPARYHASPSHWATQMHQSRDLQRRTTRSLQSSRCAKTLHTSAEMTVDAVRLSFHLSPLCLEQSRTRKPHNWRNQQRVQSTLWHSATSGVRLG
jgi:hypothetical protein